LSCRRGIPGKLNEPDPVHENETTKEPHVASSRFCIAYIFNSGNARASVTTLESGIPKKLRVRASVDGYASHYRAILQICARPPSTDNSLPFTKLESSEARNRTAVAISSERPSSLRGIIDRNFSFISGGAFSNAGVSIGPGLITFTRIFLSFNSTSHVRANDRNAALLAP